MSANRILVIGSPGAGKSTFSRKLRDLYGLPLYYLDRIHHNADRTEVDDDTFDRELKEILKKDKWIIDGNYSRTLGLRAQYADMIFLLDLPVDVCLKNVEKRRGIRREDMPWIEYEEDKEFTQYIRDFPYVQLPKVYSVINKYKGQKKIIIFHDLKEIDEWLQNNT